MSKTKKKKMSNKLAKIPIPVLQLMRRVETLAEKKADGHLTIMRFTTCWKVFLQTPNLVVGSSVAADGKIEGSYNQLSNIPGYATLEAALKSFLANPISFPDAF